MRIPEYLSPSALATWESDRAAFYLKYLAEDRPPRIPQTDYMAIGSAFDAYAKSALHAACFGPGADPQFEFDAIFTEQVEEHNRDWGLKAGAYAFRCYQASGAYAELCDDLLKSQSDPQFEFKVEATIDGVPLLGKPDCRYIHKEGAHVILDWKVNGFCSKYGASPYKGFKLVRDGWGPRTEKPSRGAGKPHKMYKPIMHCGVEIGTHYLEETCKDWADQLSSYGWLLGETVGDEKVVTCIDQLVCKPRHQAFPLIRIANHRCRVSAAWQQSLKQRLASCWKTIQSEYIFDQTMSPEESKECCETLERRAAAHSQAEEGGIEEWVCKISQEANRFRTR